MYMYQVTEGCVHGFVYLCAQKIVNLEVLILQKRGYGFKPVLLNSLTSIEV